MNNTTVSGFRPSQFFNLTSSGRIRLLNVCSGTDPMSLSREQLLDWISWKGDPSKYEERLSEWKAGVRARKPKKPSMIRNGTVIAALCRLEAEPDVYVYRGKFLVDGSGKASALPSDGYELKVCFRMTASTNMARILSPESFDRHFEICFRTVSRKTIPSDLRDFRLTWPELRTAVADPEWSSVLRSVKGVYLIVDPSTGKGYVGSAYGKDGVWGRWRQYAADPSGGDQLLKQIPRKDLETRFEWSILRTYGKDAPDSVVLEAEYFDHKRFGYCNLDVGYNGN